MSIKSGSVLTKILYYSSAISTHDLAQQTDTQVPSEFTPKFGGQKCQDIGNTPGTLSLFRHCGENAELNIGEGWVYNIFIPWIRLGNPCNWIGKVLNG